MIPCHSILVGQGICFSLQEKLFKWLITLHNHEMQSHENFQHSGNGSKIYVHTLNQCFEIAPFISYVMFWNPISVLYQFKKSYFMKGISIPIFISHEASMKPSIGYFMTNHVVIYSKLMKKACIPLSHLLWRKFSYLY